MINFGQPRVGDDDYAAFSDLKIPNQWRLVHHKDIVPHLPPAEFPFKFYHTSTEVFEDKDGNYTICQPGEDPKCCNQYWTYSIADHSTYMDKCMGSCGMCAKGEDEPEEIPHKAPHSDEIEIETDNEMLSSIFDEVKLIFN